MSPLILVGASILLLGLGMGLGYLLSYFLRSREATKASAIQNELDEYRQHVTEHFSETAQHFQELGQQYRSLYKHMAQGADALCDPAQSDAMLEFPAGDVAAIAASNDDVEVEPKIIRDYAPEEENEPVDVESTAMKSETPETPVDTSAAAESSEQTDAKEKSTDTVSKPTVIETERTVH